LRHRPHILAASNSGSIYVFIRLQEILEANNVSLDHLEDGKASVKTELWRLPHKVILSLVPQNEQSRFAGLLVILYIAQDVREWWLC
jgi:hypothetical protein